MVHVVPGSADLSTMVQPRKLSYRILEIIASHSLDKHSCSTVDAFAVLFTDS